MGDTRPTITNQDIFGEESDDAPVSTTEIISSTSSSDVEEQQTFQVAKRPTKRLLLSVKHKIAAVKQFQSNQMTHRELGALMRRKKLENKPNYSTISKMLNPKTLAQMNLFELETNPYKLGMDETGLNYRTLPNKV